MVEFALLAYSIAATVALAIALILWIEVRAFRQLNEGLGAMIMEIEEAQAGMRAGIAAAIKERAMADEKPEGRAH
jgi:hypothetical protein